MVGKQIGVAVVALAAVMYLGYSIWSNHNRKSKRKAGIIEYYEKTQCSEEIYCDNCGETTDGLNISRNGVLKYQDCPKCGETRGLSYIYYFCQIPECSEQLIRVRGTVSVRGPDGLRWVSGDPTTCPQCGQADGASPDYVTLRYAEEIAKRTNQEFP